MTLAFILVLAGLLFLYLAIPLFLPNSRSSMPDLRDPVTQDLEEERDALLRAIRELDLREDLPGDRRDALRARYEAKTAKVLRALDERQEAAPTPVEPKERRALPLVALAFLAVGLSGAAFVANNSVPEVVAADPATPTIGGGELQGLERLAERDPSEENLLALGDGYWRAQSGEKAQAVYGRVLDEITPVPAVAYERLGMLALQNDVASALRYLELARNADPENLETLYFLGEIYYANQDMAAAREAWQSYLKAPGGAGDTEVEARLKLAQTFAPLLAELERNPNEANLLSVADGYWNNQERPRAVDYYFQVLTEKNPHSEIALSRVGQQLFFGGQNREAITVLGRARAVGPNNLQTLLFLGNAHFTLGEYRKAIAVWEDYVLAAGGPELAGRVPNLISDAQERLRTGAPPPAPSPSQPAPSQPRSSQMPQPPRSETDTVRTPGQPATP